MIKYCLDANILITAWHITYSIIVFPTLWEKLPYIRNHVTLIKPIYDEIEPISSSDKKMSLDEKRIKYPVRMWLDDNNFSATEIVDEINSLSLMLEKKYEINELTTGANQNDMTLIAYAKHTNGIVVTFEAIQPQKPKEKYKYKIPLICNEEKVICCDFITMLKELKISI